MSQVKPTILVTGGAGYIGSHAVLTLLRAGYDAIVLDNLEYGHQELIETARQVTGRDINVVECDRHAGDPPILVGSSDKAREILGWSPKYSNLSKFISDAWQWHQQRHR